MEALPTRGVMAAIRRFRRYLERILTIHISLRELICIVAFFALGISSLRAGGILASFALNDPKRGNGNGIFGGSSMSICEHPDRPTFMCLAHMLLAIMLGWTGGKFAIFVYRTQSPAHIRDEQSEERKSPVSRELES